jgi:hypothetical protein
MQGFLHDAQDPGIFRAMDPDDARRVKPQAGKPWRIAIGMACRPKEKAILLARNLSRYHCRKGCHGGDKFALDPARAKFMKRAKLKAASRQGGVQRRLCQRQNAHWNFKAMALQRADLQL